MLSRMLVLNGASSALVRALPAAAGRVPNAGD